MSADKNLWPLSFSQKKILTDKLVLKRFHSTLAKFQNIGGYFVRPKHVGLGLFGNKNLAIVAKIE